MNRLLPYIAPIVALAVLAISAVHPYGFALALAVATLVGGVAAAIHHAEVVAHRVGEPFGTLVLAVSITIIEVAMILSVMLASPAENAALPRDAIFSALMIICSGVIGICLFLGGLRYREQVFRVEGASSAMAALVTLAVLTLILPRYTTSTAGPTYSGPQLAVIATLSLFLWASFVRIQTGRHRDYFLPADDPADVRKHAEPPSRKAAWTSFWFLLLSLVSVVGLAKVLSKPMEYALAEAGAPRAVLGALIALIVLLPETSAAIRSARANRLQTSMNLAMGSALASIGLTVPAVAIASLVIDLPLQLGLEPKDSILLCLTFVVNMVTLGLGRSNILLGAVHIVLFATFVLTTLVP